jgi:hypothetical protein
VLDNKTGKFLGPLPGAKGITNFTADGMRIGTIDLDGGVSVWDVRVLRRVARLGTNQTLAALSQDGHSVFIARGSAWYVQRCRACGQIPDKGKKGELTKGKLTEEAEHALEGVTKDKRFHEQFSCVGRHAEQ